MVHRPWEVAAIARKIDSVKESNKNHSVISSESARRGFVNQGERKTSMKSMVYVTETELAAGETQKEYTRSSWIE
ncbi:hypothetical protein ALC57_01797 [Trachymyrmex cornetzi]|uniref:Uncharacterized protein n=1 Tax=Trachymyrmex cornetzi TaxID=471704 RepID=A0A195ELS8_9HYME|nr:hypothetical protein ALC57_01797 [Trachymyrmex cornetzi]